jgi:hypothetical protein
MNVACPTATLSTGGSLPTRIQMLLIDQTVCHGQQECGRHSDRHHRPGYVSMSDVIKFNRTGMVQIHKCTSLHAWCKLSFEFRYEFSRQLDMYASRTGVEVLVEPVVSVKAGHPHALAKCLAAFHTRRLVVYVLEHKPLQLDRLLGHNGSRRPAPRPR